MELAFFRPKNNATISREKLVPESCNFQISVIFGHLQGCSRVCTLLVYLLGGGCGSNWLTIVGLSSSKHPENVSLLGADHRLAYSATLEIFGHLQGGALVSRRNTPITSSESKIDLFFLFVGWLYPLGDL